MFWDENPKNTLFLLIVPHKTSTPLSDRCSRFVISNLVPNPYTSPRLGDTLSPYVVATSNTVSLVAHVRVPTHILILLSVSEDTHSGKASYELPLDYINFLPERIHSNRSPVGTTIFLVYLHLSRHTRRRKNSTWKTFRKRTLHLRER